MSNARSILTIIIVTLTVATSTVIATQVGALNFFGIGPIDNKPIINGTIVNYDNKTFGILIVPTEKNVTIPQPVPQPVPVPQPNQTPAPTCDRNYIFNQSEKICQPVPTPVPTPVPEQCVPPTVWNATNKKCQAPEEPDPNPQPKPTPTPVPVKDQKVIVVGDLEDSSAGRAVLNQIKLQKPDLVAVLGDMGYESDLSWFKSTYVKSFPGKLVCVPGNHEAPEDGSAKLYAEAQQLCGEPFYNLKPYNHALFLGIDTNGNMDVQLGGAQQVVMNQTFMKDVKSVHILSHKGCISPPNSHHPAPENTDIKTFCLSLKAKIPSTVQQFWDSAHNHVYSESVDKTFKQSGAGGRSHYECGTSTLFPVCDNTHFGFLEYTIKPDGTTTSVFKDYNGKIIK